MMAQITNTETGVTRTSVLPGFIIGAIIGALIAPWAVKIYVAYAQWVIG